MKRVGVLLCCILLCGLVADGSANSQEEKTGAKQGDDIRRLIGDWSGESVCADKEKFSACNDEQVIYHVAAKPGEANTVTIAADKLVNGKPEPMGTFDFIYNAQRQTLVSEIKTSRFNIVIELNVKGDVLEGALALLPDRTTVRRIKVKKNQ